MRESEPVRQVDLKECVIVRAVKGSGKSAGDPVREVTQVWVRNPATSTLAMIAVDDDYPPLRQWLEQQRADLRLWMSQHGSDLDNQLGAKVVAELAAIVNRSVKTEGA